MGINDEYSLCMPAGKKLTRAMVESYKEIYPDAILSEDGTYMSRGGTVHSLAVSMGLCATPPGLLTMSREDLERPGPSQGPFLAESGVGVPPSPEPQQQPITREVEGAESGIKLILNLCRRGLQWTTSRGKGDLRVWVSRGQTVHRRPLYQEAQGTFQGSSRGRVPRRDGHWNTGSCPQTGYTISSIERGPVGNDGGFQAANAKR